MGDHELLIRHAETWASTKNRTLDPHVLAAVLGVWTSHEGHTALEWPAGSAERLLLQQWPHHRPIADADIGVLVESLETFWRFLRATGRLRSGSAEPRDLVKEARRAAPRMPADHRAADPQSVMEALVEWPGESGEDFDEDDDYDEYEDYYDDFAHEETWALEPRGIHDWELDASVEASARDARQSPFVQECLRFARWVDGTRVTNGVLGPAQIREAEAQFGLPAWEQEFLDRSPLQGPGLREGSALLPGILDGNLGGLDHLVSTRALQSLWHGCVSAELIKVGATTVRATPAADPQRELTENDWSQLGQEAVTKAMLTRCFLEPIDPILRVLLPFLRKGVDQVDEEEVVNWWWEHDANPWNQLGLQVTQARRASDRQVRRLLWSLDDMGLWRREGQTLHRTALGMDVAMLLLDDLPDLLRAN